MDTNNPAVRKHFEIPPALIEAVHDDPAAIQPSARVMAFKLIHEQFVESPNYTPSQKLALAEQLAKLGDLMPKTKTAEALGGGVSITINMPSKNRAPITIDSAPITQPEIIDVTPDEAEARD